jgi:hypothetical protein
MHSGTEVSSVCEIKWDSLQNLQQNSYDSTQETVKTKLMDKALLFNSIINTLIMINKVRSKTLKVTSARHTLEGSLMPFYQTARRDICKYCCTHASIDHQWNNKSNVAFLNDQNNNQMFTI